MLLKKKANDDPKRKKPKIDPIHEFSQSGDNSISFFKSMKYLGRGTIRRQRY